MSYNPYGGRTFYPACPLIATPTNNPRFEAPGFGPPPTYGAYPGAGGPPPGIAPAPGLGKFPKHGLELDSY